MKHTIRQVFSAIVIAALLMTPAVAWAHGDEDHGDDSVSSSDTDTSSDSDGTSDDSFSSKRDHALEHLRERLAEQKQAREEAFKTSRENLQERLEGAKKKACENHQNTIARLVNVMNKRRSNAYDKIEKISDAIKKFYSEQDSLYVANYDDLAAAVDAAEETAKNTLDSQLSVPELDCDGDHPRADVTEFRQKRLDSIDAMKAYRDAVKALGQAVKNAIEENKANNTGGES